MTQEPGGVESLDALLGKSRELLDLVASAGSDHGDTSVKGTGTAADGMIRVAVSPRRLDALSVDPRAMRLGSQALSAEIMSAVNAAFAELWQTAGGAHTVRGAQANAGALTGQLRDLQNDSMRSMAMFTQAMHDVVAQLRRDRT
jgi:hypothetical protein